MSISVSQSQLLRPPPLNVIIYTRVGNAACSSSLGLKQWTAGGGTLQGSNNINNNRILSMGETLQTGC